jgi:uncharacterized protein YqeY
MIYHTITTDIKTAMLEKNAAKLSALRLLKAAITNASIEKKTPVENLSDNDIITILRKEIKKCQDAADGFRMDNRTESIAAEEANIAVLSVYLPQPLSPEELEKVIAEAITETGATSQKQMGAVMKLATAKVAGRVSSQVLSAEIKKKLN